jgi:hypothetical protein
VRLPETELDLAFKALHDQLVAMHADLFPDGVSSNDKNYDYFEGDDLLGKPKAGIQVEISR